MAAGTSVRSNSSRYGPDTWEAKVEAPQRGAMAVVCHSGYTREDYKTKPPKRN